MGKTKKIIIISIALVILIVLGLLIFLPTINNITEVNKVASAQTSKLTTNTTDALKDAYYDEETGTIKGLTSSDEKIMKSISSELKNYLSDKNIKDNMQDVIDGQIADTLQDIATNQLDNLVDKTLEQTGNQLIESVGDVITDSMINSIKTNEDLKTDLSNGIGDLLGDLRGGLTSYAKAEIYNLLDDQIDNEIAKFIVTNVGKEMVNDLLSGNVTDIFSKFGDNLFGSITNGLKDFLNFKITDKLFGNLNSGLKVLLGDKLNIVGRIGNIIGIDIDKIVGLPSKMLNGLVGKVTNVFNGDISGNLLGNVTGGVKTYVDSLGSGLTGAITGGVTSLTGGITNIIDNRVLKNVTYPARQKTFEQITYSNNESLHSARYPTDIQALKTDPSLLCIGHGKHIPAISKRAIYTAQDDATLAIAAYINPQAWPDVTPGTIVGNIGHTSVNLEGDYLLALNSAAYWTHVQASNPLQKVTTHTIGRYKSVLMKLTPGASYILAHKKDSSHYSDYVQQALWHYLGQSGSGSLGENPESNTRIGQNLYLEAVALDKAIEAQQTFKASNFGKKIDDQTNYWMNNG